MVTIPNPSTLPSGTFGAFRPEAPKKSLLPYLAAVIVILLLGAAYFFFFYLNVSLFAPLSFPPAPALTSLEQKVGRLPNFPFEIFDSPFYKSLKIYGKVPVVADQLGRTNPFIPY